MNLTKTLRKAPIDLNLEKQGASYEDTHKVEPKYDAEDMWVSGLEAAMEYQIQQQQKQQQQRHQYLPRWQEQLYRIEKQCLGQSTTGQWMGLIRPAGVPGSFSFSWMALQHPAASAAAGSCFNL
jgi:hypothetical protein